MSMKKSNGHLIIHNVSAEVAERIVNALESQNYAIGADWWPQDVMDNFDTAAITAIEKQPSKFRKPTGIKHFGVEE
jgi:signal recognition particle GTPase